MAGFARSAGHPPSWPGFAARLVVSARGAAWPALPASTSLRPRHLPRHRDHDLCRRPRRTCSARIRPTRAWPVKTQIMA